MLNVKLTPKSRYEQVRKPPGALIDMDIDAAIIFKVLALGPPQA